MRDLSCSLFEASARAVGFHHVPQGNDFVSRDGQLRVRAIYKEGPGCYTQNIDRRLTLVAMKRARRANAAVAANSEATGAATPMASV